MINGKEKHSEDGNLTSSTISFIPGLEDNGKYVRCRSENLQMAKSVLEDGCLLNVHYVPRLSLALGTSLRRDTIREGADVYFECNIMANPWVSEVSWLFEEQMLFSDPSAGIIVANQSLVLQKVKRRHRGRYRCLGTNQEGTGRSKDVFLRINYAPICKPGQRFIYALARNEEASVQCEMDGDPPDAQFKWIFNNSQENNEIHSFTSNGTLSVLTYVPRTRFDFGTLVCTAENNLGPATEPCLFQIVPAGPPDAVSNCLLLNQTTESMQVECSSKDAGGLKPFFFLEVYDSVQRLLANLTNWDSPHFYVANLSPGTFYTLNIYAANSKGRSLPRRIKGATRSTPERHTGQEGTPLAIVSPLIGCLIAVVGGLLIVTGTIILVVKTRRNGNGEDNDESPNEENGKNNEPEDGNNGFTCNTLDLTSFKQTSKEIGFLKASINSVECQQINRGFYKQGFSKQSNLIRAAKPLNCLPPYNNDQLHPEISSHLRVSSSFQAGPERLSYDNLSIPSVISNGSSKRVAISHPLQPINCPDVDLYPGYRLGKQIKENCSDGDKSASSCCLDDFAELHISPMVKPDY